MRLPSLATGAALAVCLLLSAGCGSDRVTSSETHVADDAVVRFKSFEGGFYAIETVGGRHLDPVNLPVAYQQDGMEVHVRGAVRADFASVHMYGEIFEIADIARR